MSEGCVRASTDRVWLALRLFAEGPPIDEIARRLPRAGPQGSPHAEGAEGVSPQTAAGALQPGINALLAHVTRDEPPPVAPPGVWPPEEVRRDLRTRDRHSRRLFALRQWLQGRLAGGEA